MKMKKYAIIAAAAMAGMAVTACSKDEAGPDAVEKRTQVTVGIAGKNGHKVTFTQFLMYGVPVTVGSMVLASIYILVRYFVQCA